MDADIAAYNVTKGVQMKGGEKRGEAPKAKPKEQGRAKEEGKKKPKERRFIVNGVAYPESSLKKQGYDIAKLKEYIEK
jgi:hypothetical protein